MTQFLQFSHRSIRQLEDEILSLAAVVSRAEYQFLVALREFDIREGWKALHCNHCAEWLNLRCGIDVGTGREKVRVARALFDLQKISSAFESGEIGYTKVRALTRVATPANEGKLLARALRGTAASVQQFCQELRNGTDASLDDARRAHQQRWLSHSVDQSGQMTITVKLPVDAGELVITAIEQAVADAAAEQDTVEQVLDPDEDPALWENGATEKPAEPDAHFKKRADALVRMAQNYLSSNDAKACSTADRYQVLVRVDEKALRQNPSGDGRKECKSDLPIETIRRLCCDGSITPVIENGAGEATAIGRKHRIVPPATKRALLARHKHCSYPGCTHDKWLDAHHIRHWAEGGATTADNLVLLCSKHHRLLHEGGFSIKTNYRGERYFETSAGRVLA